MLRGRRKSAAAAGLADAGRKTEKGNGKNGRKIERARFPGCLPVYMERNALFAFLLLASAPVTAPMAQALGADGTCPLSAQPAPGSDEAFIADQKNRLEAAFSRFKEDYVREIQGDSAALGATEQEMAPLRGALDEVMNAACAAYDAQLAFIDAALAHHEPQKADEASRAWPAGLRRYLVSCMRAEYERAFCLLLARAHWAEKMGIQAEDKPLPPFVEAMCHRRECMLCNAEVQGCFVTAAKAYSGYLETVRGAMLQTMAASDILGAQSVCPEPEAAGKTMRAFVDAEKAWQRFARALVSARCPILRYGGTGDPGHDAMLGMQIGLAHEAYLAELVLAGRAKDKE